MRHRRIARRLILMSGVGLLLVGVVLLGLYARMQYEIHQDLNALQRPLSLLRSGQTVPSTILVLKSTVMDQELHSRGYGDLAVDERFTRVAQFDPDVGESQTYPQGMALYSYAETKDGTRSLHIWCYFTAGGVLMHVDSGVQQANML